MILALTVVVCFLTSCKETASKEEAELFAKKFVKSYFDKDCGEYLALWGDSVRLMSPYGDTILHFWSDKADTAEICERFRGKSRFTKGYTFEQYLANFEIRIYSKEEFTDEDLMRKNDEDILLTMMMVELGKKLSEDDYLFSGWYLKNHNQVDDNGNVINQSHENHNISHYRSWIKIISKTEKGWRVTGSLP